MAAPAPVAPTPRRIPKRWLQIIAGGLLFAAAFPPLGFGFLAWVALVPWTLLILDPVPLTRRQYLGLWGVGLLFWMWLLESIRKAHPALYGGWFALSAYLAVYTPVFVGWSRTLAHGGKWPAWLAIPVVWTALELVRAYLLTGFSLASLGHTQAAYPALIQLASWGGAYAVSFVVALAGAALGCLIFDSLRSREPATQPLSSWRKLGPGVALGITAAGVGGSLAMFPAIHAAATSDGRDFRVAVAQGALDVVFEMSPERDREVLRHYRDVVRDSLGQFADAKGMLPALYLLPESSFPPARFEAGAVVRAPKTFEGNAGDFQSLLRQRRDEHDEALRYFVNGMRLPNPRSCRVVVGGTRVVYGESPVPAIFNEAFTTDGEGKLVADYAKCHPVMFGEYIPFGAWFPWIYEITPLPAGITPGLNAKPFEADGRVMCPSICFESTVPQVIARHVRECRAQGKEVDALVNITNDGWFWGGAVLDLQAQCNILRAVEHSKPMIVAANTGLSMIVDPTGKVVAQAPRRTPRVLVETIRLGANRVTFYSRTGDLFAGGCWVAAVIGFVASRRRFATFNQTSTRSRGSV